MSGKYYNREIQSVLNEYHVSQTKGLSSAEAKKRLESYGPNLFTKAKEKSIFQEIKEALSEQLMVILLIAAAISVLIHEYSDAVGICFAVLLSTTIGIVTESRSKKAAEALNRMTEDIRVKVLRDGEKILIYKSELVPGDIVFLEAGDQIPADGRIITSLDLKVREDMLTGESDDVKKRPGIVQPESLVVDGKRIMQDPIPAKQFNMLFGGTLVASGQGTMVVTATGDQSEMGDIAKALDTEDDITPLQIKMNGLSELISKISTALAGMLFIYMFYQIVMDAHLQLNFRDARHFAISLKPLLDAFPDIKTAFVVCVALIVAAVPEGLPTMINVTLAITMKQMAKINVLVRKKEACETIGSISVICSDKTGTLTQNKMKVQRVNLDGSYIHAQDLYKYQHFIRNCVLNSTADLERHGKEVKYIGSATECALLLLCSQQNYQHMRGDTKILEQLPFSSQNKYMLTVVREEGDSYVYSKGAPEVILKQCAYERVNGKVQKLTPKRVEAILKEISHLQGQAMRVLAFAYNAISPRDMHDKKERLARDLIFQGFVGICDPLREGVKESIAVAREAGIETKMLTGDNLQTAVAIGKEIGLVGQGKRAVEASYIDTLTDQQLEKEIGQISIVARSKPDTKMRIVSALQKNGEVVAVTGDGINDAPALTKADVGIAMGIAGTEVSKNAADIILTDDSFSTIVEAIKWGRGIYNNFQRFIQFQLTVNIIAFLIAIVSQLLDYEMPFTTIHLLWINIIMDGPPALALGLEPIRATVMKRMPIKKDAPIINHYMIRTIAINSLLITSLLFLQIKYNFMGVGSKVVGNASEAQTALFALFAFSVLFNAFNCREFGTSSIFPNLLKNKAALYIILGTAILQVLMIQYVGSFFNAVPLSLEIWLKIVVFASSVVVINEIVKEMLRFGKASAKFAYRGAKKVNHQYSYRQINK